MRSKLLVLIITICNFTNAQTASWQWAKSAGRYTSHDYCNGIAADLNGNSYITGNFQDTIVFGSTTLINTTSYGEIMYLAKYDSAGNVIWAKIPAGDGYSNGNGICTDKFGNFYVTGTFHGTLDFGIASFTEYGTDNYFMAKFDSSGNAVWANNAICGGPSVGKSINVSSDGNVYVTGTHEDSAITFGSFTLPIYGFIARDIFLVKYDNIGNEVWAKGAGGARMNSSNSVCNDESGSVYITGSYYDSITFDNQTLIASNNGSAGVFTTKYDDNGNVKWAKSSGGFPSSGYGNGVSTDGRGNCYVTGYFQSPIIYFDGDTLVNAGINDVFVLRYDSTGNLVWLRGYGSPNFDQGKGITTDANGNSFVIGNFKDPIHFGSTTLYPVNQEIFVVQIDSSGNSIWALQSNGSINELGNGISRDGSGNIYIGGDFSSPNCIFGTTTLVNSDQFLGSYDLFVAKLKMQSAVAILEREELYKSVVFPNPFNDKATLKFDNSKGEKFTLAIYDSHGRLVRTADEIKSGEVEIDGRDLSAGLYYFRLFSDQQVSAAGKLIIE